ncbi:MAG: 4Fe-4S binding protein, partial [Phycisphaerae bacterium]
MSLTRREFGKQAAAIGLAVGGGGFIAGLGDPKGTETPGPLRPPGSLPEEEFASTCIRCLRCVDACPYHALVSMRPGSA